MGRVPARSPSPRSRTFSAPSARSSSRTRPPSSASSSALSLMRRTTSATWSSLTSSSPPPPKSLLDFTTSPNIRNFQETEKKTNGTAKAPHAEKEKKRPQLHLAPQMRTSRTRTHCERETWERNFPCHYSFRSISSAIEVQSSSPLKALISLLFFVFFSFIVCFWLEISLRKLLVIL